MGGKLPSEYLEEKELPDLVAHVWNWFIQLHKRRGSNGFGPDPLNFSEIESYFRLIQDYPAGWELNLIMRFDDIAMSHYAKEAKRRSEQNKAKSKTR